MGDHAVHGSADKKITAIDLRCLVSYTELLFMIGNAGVGKR